MRQILIVSFVLLALGQGHLTSPVNPAEAGERNSSDFHNSEHWSGFAATENSFYIYSGVTLAPFDTLAATGLRLRVAGGYGAYYYDGTLNIAGDILALSFTGETVSAEAHLGYQFRYGEWTGKLFAGIDYQDHVITPNDPSNAVSGAETGFKVLSENWINLGPFAWASLDGSYSTAFHAYNIALKGGHQIYGPFDLGIEIGAFGNKTLQAARAGLLARYRGEFVEISLTGGVSGDYDKPVNPYGNITALRKF